ncbi:ATP-binding protein [Daejeonella lutea]|uniref:ATP-binding protein n=1 Tax=Daejeonella lutea TaxID=572036 RepID=UPI0009A6F992|nr:ATP-binding protein [Daejeonella lutea]
MRKNLSCRQRKHFSTINDYASGAGLSSIKNRLSLYDRKLQITSKLGTGTSVQVKLSENRQE